MGPIGTIVGMFILSKYRLVLGWFDIVFVILYTFYYNVYYSVIPNLFFRPGYDEDGVVFDMSSSNAISTSLNITLYAYMILSRYYKYANRNKLLLISIVNLVMIVIQQSRIGILVAMVILVLNLYSYSKRFLYTSIILLICLIINYWQKILNFSSFLGNVDGLEAYKEDIRSQAQSQFFQNMDLFTFIFGHTTKNYTKDGFGYTYNVFLDIWDRYSIFQVGIFTVVLLLRGLRWKKFEFPLYYFLPFIAYSMVESIFFPNYWDVIIYIMLFTKKPAY